MQRAATFSIVPLLVVVQVFIAAGVADAQTMKVACVGDSITAGGSWCAYAGTSLGSGYMAQSFGVSGTTLLEDVGQPSFSSSNQYEPSKSFAPNIVVIMLGTNDSMPRNWDAGKDHFVKDYEALIDSYTSLASKPTVFLNTAPPASNDNMFSISGENIENEINPLIKQVAMTKMCPIVDIWAAFGGDVEKLDSFDGVHPGDAGQKVIGETVAKAIMMPMIPGASTGAAGSAGAGGMGMAPTGGSAGAGGMAMAAAGGSANAAGAGSGAGAMAASGAGGGGAVTASGTAGSRSSAAGSTSTTGAAGSATAGNTSSSVNPVVGAAGSTAMIPPTASSDDGGCRTAGKSASHGGPTAGLLILLGLALRRRRKNAR